MSIYSVKGKGWRYDFQLGGQRYSGQWYRTKMKAREAENDRRKEVIQPEPGAEENRIDMTFFDLVNSWLDFLLNYRSERHYQDSRYMAKRWIQRWGEMTCREVSPEMIQGFILGRKRNVSRSTANKELRFLRAVFNYGLKREWITVNPTSRLEFLSVDKKRRFVPDNQMVDKVIEVAVQDQWLTQHYPDTVDYLWAIRDTLGRMSEINRLVWSDVDFFKKQVTLSTRKNRGRGLSPRLIPMTSQLRKILMERYRNRDESKPWVFWNSRTGQPYRDRKKFMKRLCKLAKVPYFRFHPLRHLGASVMDSVNVPCSTIQGVLGHQRRSTTELYLRSLGGAEAAAMEVFEKAREKSPTQSPTQHKEPELDHGT